MTILRDITNAKHREVEQLPLIQTLMSGNVTAKQYAAYLYELSAIYKCLEDCAKKAGVLDGLEGIERTDALELDLAELDPNYSRLLTKATVDYLHYLIELCSDKKQRHKLLAHVYVRHMGDLYGGKLMARVVPGSGRTYQFDNRPEIIRAFNSKLTLDLGDEANKAFDFFIAIFTELWDKYITKHEEK